MRNKQLNVNFIGYPRYRLFIEHQIKTINREINMNEELDRASIKNL